VVTQVGKGRYEAKCSSCSRSSPAVTGDETEAIMRLTDLAWARAVDGKWCCPVCTSRSTARLKKPVSDE
jgi:hypothetical protein